VQYKTLDQRIEDGFDETTLRAFGVDYLKLLLDRSSELARGLRRTGTLIIVLAVVFMLLVGAEKGEVTLGPLKLTNLASVLPVFPVVISFLFYELIVLFDGQITYEQVLGHLVRRLYPRLRESELDALLAPATASLWGLETWRDVRSKPPSTAGRAVRILDAIALIVLFVVSVAFPVYAFFALYDHPHTNAVAVTVAAAITGFNVARAYLVIEDVY
jgi:hypothetical protein